MILALGDRAPIYAWLAERVAREIDTGDWSCMRQEPLRSILCNLEPELAPALAEALAPGPRDELAEEFARLFLMPGGISTHASAWVPTSDERERVRHEIRRMVEWTFEVVGRESRTVEPWGRLPADHIAVLLDLVASAALSDTEDDRTLGGALDSGILVPALKAFGPALACESKSPTYRAFGKLIASLVSTSDSF